MFSRRPHSRGSNPPLDRSTYSAAATAASSAFLQKSTSNASLSSAAAAAALRSHNASPEPVGSVQTRRMIRRGSNSSTGSGPVGRPGVQRANSNGSMTERTFRTSSPPPVNGNVVPRSLNSYASPLPVISQDFQRRASSVEPPQRVTSPTPAPGKRGTSVDGAAMATPARSQYAKRLSNVAEAEEGDRSNNEIRTNASTTLGPRQSRYASQNVPATTTAAKKYTHGMGSWFTQGSPSGSPSARATTSSGVRSSPQLQAVQSDLEKTSNQPVKKTQISAAPGSHLAQATRSPERNYGVSPGTPYTLPAAPATEYDANSRKFVPKSSDRAESAERSSIDSPKSDKVYDPNSRSFIPRSQAIQNNEDDASVQRELEVAQVRPNSTRSRQPVSTIDTTIQPPPRNPARISPGSTSPSSPRYHTLQKQPSLVLEEPEAEREASESRPIPQNVTRASEIANLPAKAYVIREPPHQRSSSLDVPKSGVGAVGRGRNVSQSPQRAAHFSPSPVMRATKHVPPGRDVSPVKSAMKHSPASSVRTNSPVQTFSPPVISSGAKSPSSETSETPSLGSHDGGAGKRKKAVRVSFHEQPEQIEPAATMPTSNWRDLSPDSEQHDMMQPRPALPSFGSVRKNRVEPEVVEKVTEMPPERNGTSSDRALGGILKNSLEPLPPEVTSKESAGYVSDESSEADPQSSSSAKAVEAVHDTDDRRQQSLSGEPAIRDFAPIASVSDEPDDVDVPAINLLPPTPGLEEGNEWGPTDSEATDKSKMHRKSIEINVPGGWQPDEETEETKTAEHGSLEPTSSSGDRRLSTEDSAATMTVTPIQLTQSPLQLSDIDEDSDDSAAFSDAVEDPSDLEDEGGFASLNAMVESPVRATYSPRDTKAKDAVPVIADSPTSRQAGQRAQESDDIVEDTVAFGGANWGETTAYWSKLSKERREQIEREHFSSDDESSPTPAPAKSSRNVRQQSATNSVLAASNGGQRVTAAAKQRPAQQSAQPTMRKSMRAQPSPAPALADSSTHMRRSMRDGAQPRPQSAVIEPRGVTQQKTTRPASSGGLPAFSTGTALQARQGSRPQPSSGPSQASSYPNFPAKKTIQQQRSNPPRAGTRLLKDLPQADDSDSESSFKKRRRAGSTSTMESNTGYNIPRSMRGGPADQVRGAVSGKQRPSSPTTGARGQGTFRFRSLSPFNRDKAETARKGKMTTLRAAPTSRPPPPSPAPTPAVASRFKSRFVDSDGEEENNAPKHSFFRSRFTDSDDEDEPRSPSVMPAELAPVRGIPRRQGREDGDSTDLDDDDDEEPTQKSKAMAIDSAEVDKAMAAARRNLGISEAAPASSKEGEALQQRSLRNTAVDETPSLVARPEEHSALAEKKRKGFMSSILRRNRNSSSSILQVGQSTPLQQPSSPLAVHSSPAAQVTPASPSSPSTGKLLRRTSYQPRTKRTDSDLSSVAPITPSGAEPGKISDKELESWPRPTLPGVVTDERPTTSDGNASQSVNLGRTMRPELAPRSQSGQPLGTRVKILAGEEGSEPGEREPRTAYSQRTGKKKKFGMLRRAFNLDD